MENRRSFSDLSCSRAWLYQHKQAASFIGVALITIESGRFKGKRIIQGGHLQVRNMLYMTMMFAIQSNPILRQPMNAYLYQANQKCHMLAVGLELLLRVSCLFY
ncbi:transposase [Photobacterium sp. 53610]|uniref:transposase n=1 Tax=Photobacterium sp. 53610 TaxID=3102789 RepID=UPI002ED9BE09